MTDANKMIDANDFIRLISNFFDKEENKGLALFEKKLSGFLLKPLKDSNFSGSFFIKSYSLLKAAFHRLFNYSFRVLAGFIILLFLIIFNLLVGVSDIAFLIGKTVFDLIIAPVRPQKALQQIAKDLTDLMGTVANLLEDILLPLIFSTLNLDTDKLPLSINTMQKSDYTGKFFLKLYELTWHFILNSFYHTQLFLYSSFFILADVPLACLMNLLTIVCDCVGLVFGINAEDKFLPINGPNKSGSVKIVPDKKTESNSNQEDESQQPKASSDKKEQDDDTTEKGLTSL